MSVAYCIGAYCDGLRLKLTGFWFLASGIKWLTFQNAGKTAKPPLHLINLLKTERRPLHLNPQSVPRCKHFYLGYKNQPVYAVSGASTDRFI
jgi:hypothetical protein